MNVNTSLRLTRGRRALKLGIVALTLGLLQAPVWAADYVWQNRSGTTFWDDPNGWTLLGVPGSGDSAVISTDSTGLAFVRVRDPRSVGSLFLNGGAKLDSSSTLTVGSLHFNAGTFGATFAGTGGVMNVTGTAVFDGAQNQNLDYSHILNLGGNASWSAGNGRLIVAQAYSTGSDSFASAQLNIGAGTTFSDEGAASASGFKTLGAGSVNNHGTYVRTGLGETFARGFNNVGTLDIASGNFTFEHGNFSNTSSGVIKVASGSTLTVANLTLTAGSIVNNGLVLQYGNDVSVAGGVQIGGAWQLDAGRLIIEGAHALDSLVVNGGLLTGAGTVTTGSLVFNAGKFGGSNGSNGVQGGGVLNVTGPATFNGLNSVTLDYNHTLNLAGDGRWTAGNGVLGVVSGGSSGASANLNIGVGTTFTDEGAASASGSKTIAAAGGGVAGGVNNYGTYLRTGVGETYALGFNNIGTLKIASGTMTVSTLLFNSSGQIEVATGARLQATQGQLSINGDMTGSGVIKTFSADYAVLSSGMINPGNAVSGKSTALLGVAPSNTDLGTLTIDGDLTLTDASVLHIDLASAGASDKLVITSDVLWNGELSLWTDADTVLQVGDVYTIASYGQRLSDSTFDSISWHGLSADQFAVDYNANSITLRVTAVPEPASYALWALGLGLICSGKWCRRVQASQRV